MHKKLSGCLRHVQIVLKKLIYGRQGFLVQLRRHIRPKYLVNKKPAQVDRQLVYQPADAQCIVGCHLFLRVKYLPHVESHFRFLVGFRNFPKLPDDRAVSHTHIEHGFRIHHIRNRVGDLLQPLITVLGGKRLDQNHVALIHRRNIIADLGRKHAVQKLFGRAVLLFVCLH